MRLLLQISSWSSLSDLGIKGADQFTKLGRGAQAAADKMGQAFGQLTAGPMSKVKPFFADIAAHAAYSQAAFAAGPPTRIALPLASLPSMHRHAVGLRSATRHRPAASRRFP